MKHIKSLLSVLLVLSMFVGLIGCSSKTEDPSSTGSGEQGAEASPSSEAGPSDQPSEETQDQQPDTVIPGSPESGEAENTTDIAAGGAVEYDLPLFDDIYELSIYWVQLGGMGGASTPAKSDLLFWQRVQEHLGVSIDFVQHGENICPEQYNLMIASEDMTDLIWESNCGAMMSGASSAYSGGYDKAIEDEVYLDLTDLLPEYAPNYWAILNDNPNVMRDLSTDSGKLYSLSLIYDRPQGSRGGLMVRTDYLEATGMSMPRSTEEWFDCMMTMKENGVTYPLGAMMDGDVLGSPFMNAFGTLLTSSYKVDVATDTLVFDATSQECRDYIEYFIRMWENGLVSPDFINVSIFDQAMILDGTNGVFGTMADSIVSFPERYGFYIQAVNSVYKTGNSNEQPLLANYENLLQQTSTFKNVVITTDCEEPEKALKFLDWFYSPDGIKATNFGFVEGESFEIVDGSEQLLPLMLTRNDDGISNELIYSLDEGPMYYLVNRRAPIQNQEVVEANKNWRDIDLDKVAYTTAPSNLTMSQKESEEVATIRNDLSSFVQAQTLKWMTCQEALTDESWDAFCDQVDKIGAARMHEIYTAAYERYKQR